MTISTVLYRSLLVNRLTFACCGSKCVTLDSLTVQSVLCSRWKGRRKVAPPCGYADAFSGWNLTKIAYCIPHMYTGETRNTYAAMLWVKIVVSIYFKTSKQLLGRCQNSELKIYEIQIDGFIILLTNNFKSIVLLQQSMPTESTKTSKINKHKPACQSHCIVL